MEKADPHIAHDAPASVAEGTSLTVTFSMRDFDREHRSESGGVLLLEIDDAEVPLPITDGVAALGIELFASATIRQRPPYFCNARMEPLSIEVVA